MSGGRFRSLDLDDYVPPKVEEERQAAKQFSFAAATSDAMGLQQFVERMLTRASVKRPPPPLVEGWHELLIEEVKWSRRSERVINDFLAFEGRILRSTASLLSDKFGYVVVLAESSYLLQHAVSRLTALADAVGDADFSEAIDNCLQSRPRQCSVSFADGLAVLADCRRVRTMTGREVLRVNFVAKAGVSHAR